jgi:hypothetical protein
MRDLDGIRHWFSQTQQTSIRAACVIVRRPPNDDPQALGYPGYCDRGSDTMAGKLDPECSHRWFNRTATARK